MHQASCGEEENGFTDADFRPLLAPFSPFSDGYSTADATSMTSPMTDSYAGMDMALGHPYDADVMDGFEDLLDYFDSPFYSKTALMEHPTMDPISECDVSIPVSDGPSTMYNYNDGNHDAYKVDTMHPNLKIEPPSMNEPSGSTPELVFTTQFHRKYWRNDRKNLQCFPVCPEYGDYMYLRQNNLEHSNVGRGMTCKSAVHLELRNCPTDDVIALSRIDLINQFGEGSRLKPGVILSAQQLSELKNFSLKGYIDPVAANRLDVHFQPTSWKLNLELSKARRPKHIPTTAPQYVFEVFCLVRRGNEYEVIAVAESQRFHINSTKTLTRELQSQSPMPSEDLDVSPATLKRALPEEADDYVIRYDANDENISQVQYSKRTKNVTVAAQRDTQAIISETSAIAVVAPPPQAVAKPPPAPAPMQAQPTTVISPKRAPANQTTMARAMENTRAHAPMATEVDVEAQPRVVASGALVGSAHDTPIVYSEWSVMNAFLIWGFLGLFGGHHFYLGRKGWGVLYLCTFGLMGIGWVCDAWRIRRMVDEVNHGKILRLSLGELYNLWFPLGLVGAHRFALGHTGMGVFYLISFGGNFLVGMILDYANMSRLHERGKNADPESDIFICWCGPFGLLGAHQYYAGNVLKGLSYTFTFGYLGVGWFQDRNCLKSMVSGKGATASTMRGGVEMQERR